MSDKYHLTLCNIDRTDTFMHLLCYDEQILRTLVYIELTVGFWLES